MQILPRVVRVIEGEKNAEEARKEKKGGVKYAERERERR